MKKIWYFIIPSALFVVAIIVLFSAFNRKLDKREKSSVEVQEEEKIVSPPFLELEDTKWTDSLLANMSLDEKIGQLFMVAAYSNRTAAHEAEISKLITENHIGGLIFMQGGPLRQVRLNNLYQSKAKIPLLMSIDGEWGLSMRLDSTIVFPRQMSLGAIQDDSLIYQMGAELGRQSRRIGLHVNFAPVIDVNNNPRNPVIGNRAFGEDKEMVSRKGILLMKGQQDQRVLATAKHFPGHGDTDSDSHKTLPVINHPRSRLDSIELYPFKRLIDKGIGSIMVAHLYIPALDSTPNTASTLSKYIVDTLLKQELDFKGLVFTDALNMKGVADYFKPGELEYRAFLAGNDVLLFAEDVPAASALIKKAIQKNEVSEEELNNRVRKILLTKQWAGLDNYTPVESAGLMSDLNNEQADLLNRRLIKASLTLLQNKNNLLPLKKLDTLKIAAVNFGLSREGEFQENLKLYTEVSTFGLASGSSKAQADVMIRKLDEFNLVIVNINGTNSRTSSRFGLPTQAPEFIRNLISSGKKVVVNIAANPYILEFMPGVENADAIIVSYDDNKHSRTYSAQGIFGGVEFTGKLPVSIMPHFKYGMGVNTSKTRLGYSTPREAGLDPSILTKVDEVVNEGLREGAFPGAQVLVARNGLVVYNKTYGHHTYAKARPVASDDLFDIASLTKIIGTIPALMDLSMQGKLELDRTLGDYLPEVKGTNKERLIIREILAHQAGLKSWIPFYLSTLSNGTYKSGIFNTSQSEEYPTQVAKNLFIRKGWEDTIFQKIIESEVKNPGTYVYSDLGYYLLQKVVERKSGMKLNELMEKDFYRPLGMNFTTYLPLEKFDNSKVVPTENDRIFRKQLVDGFVHDQGAAMLGGVAGHAGLFSNANDLAKMMQMFLQGGSYGGVQYIPAQTVDDFTRQQYCEESTDANRRGAGFDRPEPLTGGPVCVAASDASFGHSGFTGTLAWADPVSDIIYIFLSNRVHPNAENLKLNRLNIRTRIQEIVYEAQINNNTQSSSPFYQFNKL